MKILHLGKFFPPHHGGMETHLALLAARSAAFAEVVVAVAAGSLAAGSEQIGSVVVRRLRTLGVVAATPICPELFTVIRDVRPDLVHLHHPHPLAMLAYLVSGSDVPCVVSYHSDIVRQRWLKYLVAPIVRETLRRAAAILVASPQVMNGSATLSPFRDKCHLVPYGLDLPQRDAGDGRAATLRRHYGGRIVLAVGRLTRYKGFEFLVRAMRHVDATLVIVGDGPLRVQLAALAAAEGVSGRVHFAGAVTDVQPFYEACDVFVLPSVTPNEAFGLAQLEAMAAGKPVVNTNLPSGVTFACPSGVAALTVPPRDAAALAAALRRLFDEPALRRQLGRSGRAHVEAAFPADRMVTQTLDIYRRLQGAAMAVA